MDGGETDWREEEEERENREDSCAGVLWLPIALVCFVSVSILG